MICAEASYTLMLLFSVKEQDYDGSLACSRMPWDSISSILGRVDSRNFELRALNYCRAYYEAHGVAPTITLFSTVFASLAGRVDTELDLKPEDAPKAYEEADFQSLVQMYQQGCPYSPSDVAGLTEQWIRAVQMDSWTNIASNASGMLYSGKAFSEIREEAVGLLDALVGTPGVQTWEHVQSPSTWIKEYNAMVSRNAQSNPVLTGYEMIDNTFRGLRGGDYLTVLGASRDGKSTLCQNIAYNALQNGCSGAYVSLEMGKMEVQYRLYSMHSGHEKFEPYGNKVPFLDMATGSLTEEQGNFMRDFVINDFSLLPGRLTIIDGTSAGYTTQGIETVLKGLEDPARPYQFVVIDSPSLMELPRIKNLPTFKVIGELHRSLKVLADSWNNGKGIAVIAPVQASRDGIKEAERNDGFYNQLAIADSADIFRHCSQCIAISAPEWMRDNDRSLIHGLKGRWSQDVPGWTYDVDIMTGRITDAQVPPIAKPKEFGSDDDYKGSTKAKKRPKHYPGDPVPPTPKLDTPPFNL